MMCTLFMNSQLIISKAWHKLPNFKHRFFGKNYPKLLEIKLKYDPNMLFWATPGVGADLMSVRDDRVCRISKSGEHTNAPVAPDADNQNTALYVKERPSYPKLYR